MIDIHEFESIYRENYVRLYRIAFDFLLDDEQSRDVVSDVFTQAWTRRTTLDSKKVPGYLFMSVRNRCYNQMRERNARDKYYDYVKHYYENADYENLDLFEDRIVSMNKAVDKLPQTTRFVLEQCYYQHYTYKEVAQMLDMTTDGVKRHIVKAFATLRAHFHVKK